MDPFDVLIIGLLLAVIAVLVYLFIGRMVWNTGSEPMDASLQINRDLALDASLQDYVESDNPESNSTDFEKSYQLLRNKIRRFKERNR